MAYLNLDPNFFEHPKTKRLVGLLGPGAESLPIKLWCHCAKFHPEQALLQAYLPEEIEAIVGWSGEKGKMVSAMVKVGFLIKNDGDYAINDWLEHEGHIAKFKKRSMLAAKKRWGKICKSSNATSNAKTLAKHPNLTLPTLPNQALLINKSMPPTIEEVIAYCQERKNTVDPNKWHNYYTSNGWKVGKNPMKDWRAAIRTWERKETSGMGWHETGGRL